MVCKLTKKMRFVFFTLLIWVMFYQRIPSDSSKCFWRLKTKMIGQKLAYKNWVHITRVKAQSKIKAEAKKCLTNAVVLKRAEKFWFYFRENLRIIKALWNYLELSNIFFNFDIYYYLICFEKLSTNSKSKIYFDF